MAKEISTLEENNTWEYVVLPPDKKAIASKWVYKFNTMLMGPLRDIRLV